MALVNSTLAFKLRLRSHSATVIHAGPRFCGVAIQPESWSDRAESESFNKVVGSANLNPRGLLWFFPELNEPARPTAARLVSLDTGGPAPVSAVRTERRGPR